MNNVSCLIQLTCSSCGRSFNPLQIQTYCQECNAPILAGYDLEAIKHALDRDRIKSRPRGMWRWSEVLPLNDPKNIITLGEGDTPLLRLTKLGNNLGLPKLYLKDEANNPTGSFKARGLSMAISKAVELGIKRVLIPSAGNAGGALAAYAARAGLDALVYMPKSAPSSNFIECQIYGAAIESVDGLIDSAGKYAEQKTAAGGWFNMSTFKEPYRVEGKKIMGYEIAESLDWVLPDVIIYPTGGGTGLVGMWKAFSELQALGWLESRTLPRMIAVQAEGCSPVVKAIQLNKLACDPWENAHTIATGLNVPKSFADKLILKDIRHSRGTAISVSDQEISYWQATLARQEGIFSCPEGAATLAAVHKLVQQANISPEETVVVFNTGSGLKYIR